MLNARRHFLAASLGLSICVYAGGTHATVMQALSLRDLVANADVIARVRVGHRQVQQDPRTRRIHSLTEVVVTAPMLGARPQQSFLVRTWGGQVGSLGMRVEGEAELVEGEDALVFLTQASPTTHRVLGMSQGLFHITRDASGETATQLGGAALLAQDGRGNYQSGDRALPASTPARSLVAQVAALIAELRVQP